MRILPILFLVVSLSSYATDEAWVPEVNFKLETSDFYQTLQWVSGVAYILSKFQETGTGNFCGAPKTFGSRELLNYLNNAHSGLVITAEQAIDTIYNELKSKYKCE